MPVRKYADIEEVRLTMDDAVGVSKKVPIGKEEGWEAYTLRVFTIAPGGHTPKHQHDWEHINYVISGKGRLTLSGTDHEIAEKDFAFVPPNTEHQFRNPYDQDFEFICIVPNHGEY
ncbi:MAG: cupin domain-containing protein [Candidatus Aminicenantes bacterium]|nr:cupin domain-containing protein [Candidatus Aminicenantes bacterium]